MSSRHLPTPAHKKVDSHFYIREKSGLSSVFKFTFTENIAPRALDTSPKTL